MRRPSSPPMPRRTFLRLVPVAGLTAVALPSLVACGDDGGGSTDGAASSGSPTSSGSVAAPGTSAPAAAFESYGSLGEPDANGLRLPEGFTSRVVATSGEPVGATGYVWPPNPDGAAVFAQPDSGWIYVANSESPIPDGGASMLRFDQDGEVVDARRILEGSVLNCAGGATPWGTWLSCEEVPTGLVYECDPTGQTPAVRREALGVFQHEAAASDPQAQVVYLTEDVPDGALYRFVPSSWGDLSAGELQVLVEDGGTLGWRPVPDPSGATSPTKDQVPGTKRFVGGEGADVYDGVLWFSTKGDNRLWQLTPTGEDGAELEVVWDGATADDEVIVRNVDNVKVTADGIVYVAEDGEGTHVVVVGPDGAMWPVAQVTDAPDSEVTGPAFSPDGSRLYFSSQRSPGRTYEVSGPFFGA